MSREEIDVKTPSEIILNEEVEYETTTSRKNIFFWAMYDLANTIYSMAIVSFIINKYVLVIGQLEYGMSYGSISFLFGTVTTLMQLAVAICVPILGALSDNVGKRKPFIIGLTGIILLFASLLGFTHDITTVLLFYVIANIAYQFSLVFYDSMLPFIAKREDIGKVAGFGVAWGYLGTILVLLFMLPLTLLLGDLISIQPHVTDPPIQYGFAGYWFSFVIPMVLFLVCAIPFLYVREKQKVGKRPPIITLVRNTFKQLRSTFKDVRKHKSMFIFIIGYFFVVDIANVIVAYMIIIVTDGLILAGGSNFYALLLVIIFTMSAVVFTYFVGKFGQKHGAKNTFFLVGAMWGVSLTIAVILIFSTSSIEVGLNLPFILTLVMGIIAGPALGGTWTAQRIMIVELAPKEKFGEFFGFSKLSGKFSSALGPFIWGTVLLSISLIGKAAYGWAIIAVGIIMGIGIIIISRVKSE
ncbi:MAG: MFS transporter [Candidatus Lokiarchaeia archaeon]|nr:MFS transporter [Candidatus Lokiarchaeia archaeon]